MSAVIAWVLDNPRTAATYVLLGLLIAALGVSRIQLVDVRSEYTSHLEADQKAISDAKCGKRLTFNQDQGIHIGCKLVWFVFWLSFR